MRGRGRASGDRRQIVVGGLGGQGVLLVTRLLADAAIRSGKPVLTSETHGMAQRGGIVVSHLKVGGFSSPLVRAARADGLIVLSKEALPLHRPFLRPEGWLVINASVPPPGEGGAVHAVDADALALASDDPRSLNMIVLGFALARMGGCRPGGGPLGAADAVLDSLRERLKGKGRLLEASLAALSLGMERGSR